MFQEGRGATGTVNLMVLGTLCVYLAQMSSKPRVVTVRSRISLAGDKFRGLSSPASKRQCLEHS